MFSAEGKAEAAASVRLKGSNEVTSDPVGPLLASYVERPGYVMRSRAVPPGAGRASTLPPLHLMVEPRHRCARRRYASALMLHPRASHNLHRCPAPPVA